MGLLDPFKETRAMRYQKADRVYPATLDDSRPGVPSKGAPAGRSKHASAPMGGVPLPLPAPNVRPRRNSSSSCSPCHCLWCFFSFLIILIILVGITALIIYVVFLPQLPKYSLQDVAITQLAVTNRAGGPISSLAELQNPVLNADIAFTILVENPNEKVGIHYKDVSVFVFYQGSEFAHSFVAPFYQGRKSSSNVVVDMKVTSAPLSESQGKELQVAISQNDVPLLVRINVGAALEIGSWVLPPGHVQVVCDVRVSPPTAPQGAKLLSKSCKWVK
ncbi:hypothetical protein M758_4G043200 [Ceratodon purpureus]|nr:hypothetical protein M758_4G043200 [Ceratodon purpureus]